MKRTLSPRFMHESIEALKKKIQEQASAFRGQILTEDRQKQFDMRLADIMKDIDREIESAYKFYKGQVERISVHQRSEGEKHLAEALKRAADTMLQSALKGTKRTFDNFMNGCSSLIR